MAGDDLFKRYLEIGASILGMTRERAESIVNDLVASGEVAKSQAGKAADWLVERGRAGTEELAELVRREIRQQIAALGLATKDDLARLEARIEEVRASAANAATPTAAAAKPAAKVTKATKAPKPVEPAEPATTTKSAGISRSGSVRKRPGGTSSGGSARSKE